MLNRIIGCALVIFLLLSCNQIETKHQNSNKDLISDISFIIDSLYHVDQKIQKNIIDANIMESREEVDKLYLSEKTIFKRHIPILKTIYNKIGYPTTKLVGKETSNKYFIMVQHADADVTFQREMLKHILIEVNKGNIEGWNYAYLKDRVSLSQNEFQVFGTQVTYDTEVCRALPLKLVDSVHVNQKRKEIGLEPIEEYLDKLSRMHFDQNREHYNNLGIHEPFSNMSD